MAGRSMALDVLVRLRDHMSGPLRALRNNLSRLAGFARRIGALGAVIGAISFMGPIQEAAAFQQKLLDIAGTAELTGQKAFAFVDQAKTRYEGLALQIGQSSDTIAEGIGAMVAAGGDAAGAADKVIGDIGKATTAANANFGDMSNVGISMLNNLKLPADQMRDSLGALVVAGKLGSFELKDMTASFPSLTSGVAKFGVKGREAVNFLGAALQIARKGTADPSSAANNLDNFLGKALAPLTKKNFAKHGVDIEAVMMDAAAKGINPIEAVIQKIGKLTGVNETQIAKYMATAKKNGLEGADALGYVREQLEKIGAAGKVGELFQDKQVLDFLVPFLANIDEYKDIKAKVAAATGAVTDADFDTQMQGVNRQLAIFREIGTQASREVGLAFGSWLPGINAGLIAALAWMRELDKSTGGMVRKALTFAGAGLILVAALGALGFVLPIVGAGLAAIGALLGVVLSPIGLAVGALAGAGAYIWKNWDRYGGRVMRLWDKAKSAFKGLSSAVVDRGRAMISAGRRLAERYGPVIADALVSGMERIGAWGGGIAAWFDANWDDIRARSAALWRDMAAFGAGAAEDIKAGWANLQPFFDGLFGKGEFQAIGQRLSEIFTLDNAKVAAFSTLAAALDLIKTAWAGLREFGSGLAPFLGGIGENMGGTIKAVGDIGSALGRLGSALAQLAGIDTGKVGDLFLRIAGIAGGVVGRGLELATGVLKGFADGVAQIVNGLADLVEAVNKGIDWTVLVPEWVSTTAEKIAAGVRAIASAFGALKQAIAGFQWPTFGAGVGGVLPNGTPAGDPDKVGPSGLPQDRERALEDFTTPPVVRPPQKQSSLEPLQKFAGLDDVVIRPVVVPPTPKPANLNTIVVRPVVPPPAIQVPAPAIIDRPEPTARPSSAQASVAQPQGRQFAAAVPRDGRAAPVRLDGQIGVVVKVDGPGKVAKVASDNPSIVPSGRMVGRV